jgi:5-methylcytosine-specific restriction endonuclease McrA
MDSLQYKACFACKEILPTNRFGKDARASSGLQSSCRECLNLRRRAAYGADPQAARAKRRDYYSTHKEIVLAVNKRSNKKFLDARKSCAKQYYERIKTTSEFARKQSEYLATNKEAKKEYDIAYRAKNSARLLAQKQTWIANNKPKRRHIARTYKAKRRSWVKGGASSAVLHAWESVQPKTCFWCKAHDLQAFHIDHYMPLSKGGLHEPENWVIACAPCNLKKNARHPLDFLSLINQQEKVSK